MKNACLTIRGTKCVALPHPDTAFTLILIYCTITLIWHSHFLPMIYAKLDKHGIFGPITKSMASKLETILRSHSLSSSSVSCMHVKYQSPETKITCKIQHCDYEANQPWRKSWINPKAGNEIEKTQSCFTCVSSKMEPSKSPLKYDAEDQNHEHNSWKLSQKDSNVEQTLEIIQAAVKEERERTSGIGDVWSLQRQKRGNDQLAQSINQSGWCSCNQGYIRTFAPLSRLFWVLRGASRNIKTKGGNFPTQVTTNAPSFSNIDLLWGQMTFVGCQVDRKMLIGRSDRLSLSVGVFKLLKTWGLGKMEGMFLD